MLEPWFSSLLFSVSQSHVLSKIDGACGQGNPNIIATHQVYSQGDCDPLIQNLSEALFGYCKGWVEHTNALS